jgi:hypothetical protein
MALSEIRQDKGLPYLRQGHRRILLQDANLLGRELIGHSLCAAAAVGWRQFVLFVAPNIGLHAGIPAYGGNEVSQALFVDASRAALFVNDKQGRRELKFEICLNLMVARRH